MTPADFFAELAEPARILQIVAAAGLAAIAAFVLTPAARAIVATGARQPVPAGAPAEDNEMAALFAQMFSQDNADPAESKWLARWVPPTIGAIGGAYVGAISEHWAVTIALLALVIGSSLLVPIDQAAQRLPDKFVWPTTGAVAILLALAAAITGAWENLLTAVLAALVIGVAYFALAWFRPKDLGLGDVKLSLVVGLALGWFGWMPLVVGSVSGFVLFAVIGLLMLLGRMTYFASQLAFGPWMLLGAFVGITYGTFA